MAENLRDMDHQNVAAHVLLVNDISRYMGSYQNVSSQTVMFVAWNSATMPRTGVKAKYMYVLLNVELHGQVGSTLSGKAVMADHGQKKIRMRSIIEILSKRPRSANVFGFAIENRDRLFLKHTGLHVNAAVKRILNSLRLTTLMAMGIFSEKLLAAVSMAILSSTDFQKITFAYSVSTAIMPEHSMVFVRTDRTILKVMALAVRE